MLKIIHDQADSQNNTFFIGMGSHLGSQVESRWDHKQKKVGSHLGILGGIDRILYLIFTRAGIEKYSKECYM